MHPLAPSKSAMRAAAAVRWGAAAVIAAALLVLARVLPIDSGLARFERWVDRLGVLGPLVFAAIYIVGSLVFVPAAALTIAAGAVFGLVGGTAVVWAASTATAALAFVIARYLARDQVEHLARRQPKFAAIDHAVGDGGWKVVALLRLVPLFPFSIANYILGLTRIRFGPCVLSSAVFMLPSTIVLVYVGYLGVESLEVVSLHDGAVGAGRIVLLAIGLGALGGMTVLLMDLARRRLAEATEAALLRGPGAVPAAGRAGWTGTIALAALALVLAACAVWVCVHRERFTP